MADCRSCGAPIRWEITAHGKKIPLDETPVDRGNLWIRCGVATAVDDETPRGARRFVSHFATCPNANEHRRSK